MFPGCPSKRVPDRSFAWMLMLAARPHPPHPPGHAGEQAAERGAAALLQPPGHKPTPVGPAPVGARVPGGMSALPGSLRIPAGHEHLKKRLPLPRLPVPRAGTEAADASKSSHAPSEALRLAAVPAGFAARRGSVRRGGGTWWLPGLNFLARV